MDVADAAGRSQQRHRRAWRHDLPELGHHLSRQPNQMKAREALNFIGPYAGLLLAFTIFSAYTVFSTCARAVRDNGSYKIGICVTAHNPAATAHPVQ